MSYGVEFRAVTCIVMFSPSPNPWSKTVEFSWNPFDSMFTRGCLRVSVSSSHPMGPFAAKYSVFALNVIVVWYTAGLSGSPGEYENSCISFTKYMYPLLGSVFCGSFTVSLYSMVLFVANARYSFSFPVEFLIWYFIVTLCPVGT